MVRVLSGSGEEPTTTTMVVGFNTTRESRV